MNERRVERPEVDVVAPDPLTVIRTGDWVRVDPGAGRAEVWLRDGD